MYHKYIHFLYKQQSFYTSIIQIVDLDQPTDIQSFLTRLFKDKMLPELGAIYFQENKERLTYEKLGEIMGCSYSTVSAIVNDRQNLQKDQLEKLKVYFHGKYDFEKIEEELKKATQTSINTEDPTAPEKSNEPESPTYNSLKETIALLKKQTETINFQNNSLEQQNSKIDFVLESINKQNFLLQLILDELRTKK